MLLFECRVSLRSVLNLRFHDIFTLIFVLEITQTQIVSGIRDKQWVLSPHAVTVIGSASGRNSTLGVGPKANMFATSVGRYAVPVVAAELSHVVTIQLSRLVGVPWASITAAAHLPGEDSPVEMSLREVPGGAVTFTTPPLPRGAALCVLTVKNNDQ